MKLSKYIDSLSDDELSQFACKAHTSIAYLKQLASGYRQAGVKSIYNIEIASDKKVTISDLRPELGKLK